MSNNIDYNKGESPDWNKHSIHIIEELRRLSNQLMLLTDKLDEQQDEFHTYRMETVRELNNSKIDNQKEISRLDKELTEIKTKVLAISAGIGILINLAWGTFVDKPQKKETGNKQTIEHIEEVKK